jgi:glucokinase
MQLKLCGTNENATMHEAPMTPEGHKSVLVYDVGGSHVSAALCQDGAYRLGRVVSGSHAGSQTADGFLKLLYSLGMEAADGSSACGAQIAVPGPFDFDAGVSLMQHKLPYLYGLNLAQLLAQRFAWRADQVRFVHDAAAFLLGEIGAGAAREASRAIGITLGTGIGSAYSVDGRLVTDGDGVPPGGEIWNLPYEDGIVEDSISARAIRRSYERHAHLVAEPADIASKAPNDSAAAFAFSEFGRHLGSVLRIVAAEFRPDVLILGGGISRSACLFLPPAHRELGDLNLRLQVSALGEEAALVGAAVAWRTRRHSHC